MDLSFATFYWKNPVTKQLEFLFAKKAGKGDKYNTFYHETNSFAQKLYGDILGLISPYDAFQNIVTQMPKPHQKTQLKMPNGELHKVHYIYINYNPQLIKSIIQFKDYLDKCPQIAKSCAKYPYSVYTGYAVFNEMQVITMIKAKSFTDRALEALSNFQTVLQTLRENMDPNQLTLPLSVDQGKLTGLLTKAIKNKKAMGNLKQASSSYLAQLAQTHLAYYKGLKKPYQQAIDYYTQNGYKVMNQYLRGDLSPGQLSAYGLTEDSLKSTINNMNQVLNNAPVTTQSITVYRGVNFDDLPKFNNLKPGQVVDIFRDSFTSTSFTLSVSTSNDFSGQQCCLFVVHLPPGVKGLYIGKDSSQSHEDEFIMAPGPLFRVMKFKHDPVPKMGVVKSKPNLRFYHLYCIDCQQAYEKYNNIVYYNLVGPALAVSKTPTQVTHKSPAHSPIDKAGKITSKKGQYTKTHNIGDEAKTLVGLSKYVNTQPMTHLPIKDTKFKPDVPKASIPETYQLFVQTYKILSLKKGFTLTESEIKTDWDQLSEKVKNSWMVIAYNKPSPDDIFEDLVEMEPIDEYNYYWKTQYQSDLPENKIAEQWNQMPALEKGQWLKSFYMKIPPPISEITVTTPQVPQQLLNDKAKLAYQLYIQAMSKIAEKNGYNFTTQMIAKMWMSLPPEKTHPLINSVGPGLSVEDVIKQFTNHPLAGLNLFIKVQNNSASQKGLPQPNIGQIKLMWASFSDIQKKKWNESAYTGKLPIDPIPQIVTPVPQPYKYDNVWVLFSDTWKLLSNKEQLGLTHDEILKMWSQMGQSGYDKWASYMSDEMLPEGLVKYIEESEDAGYSFYLTQSIQKGLPFDEIWKQWQQLTNDEKKLWQKSAYTGIAPIIKPEVQPQPYKYNSNNLWVLFFDTWKLLSDKLQLGLTHDEIFQKWNHMGLSDHNQWLSYLSNKKLPEDLLPVIKHNDNVWVLFLDTWKLLSDKQQLGLTNDEILKMWNQMGQSKYYTWGGYLTDKKLPEDLLQFIEYSDDAGYNFYFDKLFPKGISSNIIEKQWKQLPNEEKKLWQKSAYMGIAPIIKPQPAPAPAPAPAQAPAKIPLKKKPITGYNWFLKEQIVLAQTKGQEKPSIMKVNHMWGQLTQSEKDKYTSYAEQDKPIVVPGQNKVTPALVPAPAPALVPVINPVPIQVIPNIDLKYYDGLQPNVITKLAELAQPCPQPNTIKNPKSGICVGISGKVGKGIITNLISEMAQTLPVVNPAQTKIPIPIKTAKPVPVQANIGEIISIPNIDPVYLDGLSPVTLKLIQKLAAKCEHNTIKNWKTGHCVKITGTLGKKLIKELIADPNIDLKYV